MADLRGSLSYDNAADYNQGQNIGDALSIFMGGAEASGGAGKAEAGVLIMTTTGFSGAGAVAGGKLTLSGAFETAHGTLMMTNGSKNLNSQKGRVDEGNGKYTPKDKKTGETLKTEKSASGKTKIDGEARGTAHTQLRTDKTGNYPQRTTFDSKGRKRADTHFTNHNEAGKSNPHKHTYYKDGRRQKNN